MAAILQSDDPAVNDTAYCWGDNTGTSLVVPPGVKFKAISAGEGFTAGLVLDPGPPGGPPGPLDGTVRIWGWNEAFQGGIGCGNFFAYSPPDGKFSAIAAGGHHLLLLRDAPGTALDRTLLRLKPNCDGSTTPPVLNVLDFGCFNNKFVACVGE